MQNNILYYIYPSEQGNKVFLVSNPNIELEEPRSNFGYNHAAKNQLYYSRLRNSSLGSLALHALLISLLSAYTPAKQQTSAEQVVHSIRIEGSHQLLAVLNIYLVNIEKHQTQVNNHLGNMKEAVIKTKMVEDL